MENGRPTTLLGVGMVALGCAQVAYAATRSDAVLAVLGLLYAALGGAILWRTRRSPA